ncbi:MAG: hypothetical protein HC831_30185 [Chloroflexia bacterium]|nr:hypothetical protein [Chloroflexia bacterium]
MYYENESKDFLFSLSFWSLYCLFLIPTSKITRIKIVEKYKEENPLTGALGAGDLVKEVIAYKNYHICSVGKISVTDESVSIGIAGFVYVYGSLDLMKYKDLVPK